MFVSFYILYEHSMLNSLIFIFCEGEYITETHVDEENEELIHDMQMKTME